MREMQIKTTMRYLHIPILIAKMRRKNSDSISCWLGYSATGTLILLVGMQNDSAILENSFTVSREVKHILTT